MNRRLALVLLVLGVLVLIIFVPIAIARLRQKSPRSLRGASLAELSYEEITFRNEEQHIDLSGLLFLPTDEGPVPAVVFIHGSGTSRRDNPWYLAFVRHLQRNGIAVLLPDKRGSGSSGGDWRTASLEDLATDTLAAIDYLRSERTSRILDVGVLGASQGGQIAPVVASQSEHVGFAISVVGAAVPIRDALRYEENFNLREMGLLPGVSNGVAAVSAWYIRAVSHRDFWDAVGDFDPLPYWSAVDVPALALYGDLDTNVPSRASVARLAALNNPNVRVYVFEGSGHALEDPVGEGDSVVREDALKLISDFVRSATGS